MKKKKKEDGEVSILDIIQDPDDISEMIIFE